MKKIVVIVLVLVLVAAGILTAVLLTRSPGIEDNTVVNTRQGPVRGYLASNQQYYAFLGIPYGTINETNRFKQPHPPPTWTEVREPVLDVTCPQISRSVSEDCLVVNVYTPVNNDDTLLPVIVEIHGGAFQFGSPTIGPDYLINHDVLVVTFTYRIGVLGFLCAGTEDVPGNAGMKDQVFALRWVRDNIAAFGGDPDQVTISGASAGGSSADLHVLSPMSSGLFHRAIVRSGSAMSSWAAHRNGTVIAVDVARVLGVNVTNLDELNSVLMDASLSELLNAATLVTDTDTSYFFNPCVENEFSLQERFLSESPFTILQSGRQNPVPLLVGFNDREGIYFLESELVDSYFDKLNELFPTYIPDDLKFPEENLQNLQDSVKNFYFANNSINMETVGDYIDFRTDSIFFWAIYWRVLLQRVNTTSKIFFYEFLYDGAFNFGKIQQGLSQFSGASHGDDRGYLFNTQNIQDLSIYPEDDVRMIEIMTTLLTNFAKYGEPIPEETEILPIRWDPVQPTGVINYMRLDIPLTMAVNPYPIRMGFWQRLYEQYYLDVLVDES